MKLQKIQAFMRLLRRRLLLRSAQCERPALVSKSMRLLMVCCAELEGRECGAQGVETKGHSVFRVVELPKDRAIGFDVSGPMRGRLPGSISRVKRFA